VSGIARAWNRPETPCVFTGLGIVGIHEAAYTRFSTTDADHDLAVDREGRQGHAVTGFVVGNLDRPALDAALHIKRYEVAI
jgi:hypothetical protein